MTCEYCYGDAMNTPIICMPTLKVNVRVRNSDFEKPRLAQEVGELVMANTRPDGYCFWAEKRES